MYSMQKRGDGWVISVGDDEILTCTRRTTAINVIRLATRLEQDDALAAMQARRNTAQHPTS